MESMIDATAAEPHRSCSLEQRVCPDDVGVDERVWAGDRSIDVTLGGEVEHGANLMLTQKTLAQSAIANVAVDEFKSRRITRAFDAIEVGAIARISERVEYDNLARLPRGEALLNKVGADESRAAGDKNGLVMVHVIRACRCSARWFLRANPRVFNHRVM